MNPIFEGRIEAGRLLARKLSKYADRDEVLVLALPRGGVPVAFDVAQKLHAPLDVFVVRKLGVPGHEEFDMGAIASGGDLPEAERVSHYFEANLPDQFDAVIHIDETRAVEPLERTVEWEQGEVAETFPTGI